MCPVKPYKVLKVIVACVGVHDIAKGLGDCDFEHDEEIPEEDDNFRYIAGDGEIRGRLCREGQALRRNFWLK